MTDPAAVDTDALRLRIPQVVLAGTDTDIMLRVCDALDAAVTTDARGNLIATSALTDYQPAPRQIQNASWPNRSLRRPCNWAWILVVLAANFGPGPIAFMRTTRRGNKKLRDVFGD